MRILDDFTNCENDVKLRGKVAVVTGTTSGTGLEVARELAKRGAKVIIASRNQAKLMDAKESIIKTTGNQNVIAKQMDFASLQSIRNFVDDIKISEPNVNILVNNIGAIGLPDQLTNDNLHLMMQVNYFGAFLLSFLLFPLLKASAPSRIVNVSSISLLLGYIDLEHMNDVGRYSSLGYYCNAKLADVIYTVEMSRRIKGSGVNVYSMDPGLGKTEFFRNFEDSFIKEFVNAGFKLVGRPVDRIATMPVFLATDPRVENASGKHFRDCYEFYSSWFANDTVLSRKLWETSKKLVKITPDEDWER